MALLFIDRLVRRQPYITVNKMSCHRLLLTGMVVAAKTHDDRFYTNKFYARIGGVELQDLNLMEARFLKLLDWAVFVKPEEFKSFSCACESILGMAQGRC